MIAAFSIDEDETAKPGVGTQLFILVWQLYSFPQIQGGY
jgi:hypothetical protein